MSDTEGYTTQDEVDIALMNAIEQPLDRTVLEIWKSILDNTEAQAQTRIEPGFASYVLKSWPTLVTIKTLPSYYALFHTILIQYRDVLDEQLRLHPDALSWTAPVGDPESDAIKNREIYSELLFQWNLVTAIVERAWDVTAPDSAERLAAMADAQAYITGGTGIMQALSAPQVMYA